MKIEEKQLPNGWEIKKFEDLLDYIQPTKYIVDSTEYSDEYKTPVLTAGKSFVIGYTNEKQGIFNQLPVIIFDDFTTANKFVKFPFKVKSSAMKILKPKDNSVNIEFVFYYMQTVRMTFDTHKRYWISTYSKLPVPIPPKDEQQKIVAKIEELFSELENGKQELLTAQAKLKTYRQSLLKWAFEGRLTNENLKEGELPKGWEVKKLGDITSILGDGLHGTPQYCEQGEYYFINGNNLTDGRIEIKENTKRVKFDEFKKYKKPLNEKTILVSINGTLGYTAFYNDEKVMLGKSACYFNVLDFIDKYYIRYFLTSNNFIKYANKNATGSTIKNVGLKTMRELQIAIPPLPEQQKIVAILESKLTICDAIEETIKTSINKCEALRQSILKKAFLGTLINKKNL